MCLFARAVSLYKEGPLAQTALETLGRIVEKRNLKDNKEVLPQFEWVI